MNSSNVDGLQNLPLHNPSQTALDAGDAAASSAKSNTAAAFADGNAILSFGPNIDNQTQQDVLHATLFSQLAANKTVLEKGEGKNGAVWFERYSSILGSIGWITENSEMGNHTFSGKKERVDAELLSVLGSIIAGSNVLNILKAALNGVNNLPQDSKRRFALFSNIKENLNFSYFQAGIVDKNENSIHMRLSSVTITGEVKDEEFLFFDFTSEESQLHYESFLLRFDQDIYAGVRSVISGLLSTHASDAIKNIQI